MTVVREPIDHFLSGWAECGLRFKLHKKPSYGRTSDDSYDIRVQQYLNTTLDCTRKRYNKDLWILLPKAERNFCACTEHVHPQSLFLLFKENGYVKVDPKLDLVGDLKELKTLVRLVGFTLKRRIKAKRVAEKNVVKTTFFPKRKDLLSDSTLKLLCDYLVMDYLLFDYEPPSACHEQIMSDFVNILEGV